MYRPSHGFRAFYSRRERRPAESAPHHQPRHVFERRGESMGKGSEREDKEKRRLK